MRKTLAILLIFLLNNSFAQYTFSGIIVDSSTNQPIMGANVLDLKSGKGTICNEKGEFVFNSNGKTIELVISHLSFQKTSEIFREGALKIIKLKPSVISLPEAQVGNPAVTLLNLVVKKAIENAKEDHIFKGFYQKTSSFGGKYTKIHEMFLEASWGTNGIHKWKPINVRFAQENFQKYTAQNNIFAVFFQTSIYKEFINFPLNSTDINNNYNYKMVSYINEGQEDEVAIISCTPKNKKNGKTNFTGDFYVNTKHLVLLEIKGIYNYAGSKKWNNKKEITIGYNMVESKSVFQYLHVIDTSTNKLTFKKNIDKSWLYFLEDIKSLSPGKSYEVNEVKNDLDFLRTEQYQKKFWDNNVPIKHTKLEKEIIDYFNKKGSFEGNIK